MAQVGKVYLVGAGPGDPGLLTLKGLKCLEQADLVLYDGLVNPLILRHTKATAERTCRVGCVGDKHLDQPEINRRLIEAARQGQTVVRLKGGDPFIFGRGGEEALALAEARIPFEVVPGVTAAIAAAEYAGISLTHRELASAVAFVTGHEDPSKPERALDYSVLAGFPGTLVFYMGLHRLEKIARALIDHGKSATTPAAVISKGTMPSQQVVTGSLADIARRVRDSAMRPPSLIVVGECVSQRERINWFETLPLAGLTIGITRPEGQADDAIEHALSLGAQPVLMPTIEIRPLDDWSEVDAALDRINTYDWLIFTSVNGVDAFLGRMWDRGRDARGLAHAHIAAIGPATAERLRHYSLRADVVPSVYRGEELAAALKTHVAGRRVLWLRASRGRDVLPDELTAAGAQFEQVVVYRHIDLDAFPLQVTQLLDAGELDWIALSSPTIARNVARILGARARTCGAKFATISPVTADAAREAGLVVSAVATNHTWDGIFAAIGGAK